MLDQSSNASLQRARGRAEVGFVLKNGATKIDHLHQSGCLKAMLPKVHSDEPQVVFVNTAGGVTGGDKLKISASLAADCQATFTTQAAERIYKADSQVGELSLQFEIAAGAQFSWLPQETILFDGAAFDRRMNVNVASGASALLSESYMLGREAMGETIQQCWLTDKWNVRRDGKLCFAEALRVDDPKSLGGTAGLQVNRAFATLLYVADDAEVRLEQMRSLLEFDGVLAAASAWNGQLVTRFIAPNSFALRNALSRTISNFQNKAMPRVWQF